MFDFTFIRTRSSSAAIAAVMVVLSWVMVLGGCAGNTGALPHGDAASYAAVHEPMLFQQLFAEALDTEALYTLVGGLKPMSTGFWRGSLDTDAPDAVGSVRELARVRAALSPLRDDTYYADVQAFATSREEKRHLEAYVVHRASLSAMIAREAAFWSPLGVTPCTHPAEVLAVVDRMAKAERWRGYGLLFGYPNYAIDFFVEANRRSAEAGSEVGPGKDREFLHIPTFKSAKARFTYAVPLGHSFNEADRILATQAAAILHVYAAERQRLIEAASPAAALKRLWVAADARNAARPAPTSHVGGEYGSSGRTLQGGVGQSPGPCSLIMDQIGTGRDDGDQTSSKHVSGLCQSRTPLSLARREFPGTAFARVT